MTPLICESEHVTALLMVSTQIRARCMLLTHDFSSGHDVIPVKYAIPYLKKRGYDEK